MPQIDFFIGIYKMPSRKEPETPRRPFGGGARRAPGVQRKPRRRGARRIPVVQHNPFGGGAHRPVRRRLEFDNPNVVINLGPVNRRLWHNDSPVVQVATRTGSPPAAPRKRNRADDQEDRRARRRLEPHELFPDVDEDRDQSSIPGSPGATSAD